MAEGVAFYATPPMALRDKMSHGDKLSRIDPLLSIFALFAVLTRSVVRDKDGHAESLAVE